MIILTLFAILAVILLGPSLYDKCRDRLAPVYAKTEWVHYDGTIFAVLSNWEGEVTLVKVSYGRVGSALSPYNELERGARITVPLRDFRKHFRPGAV